MLTTITCTPADSVSKSKGFARFQVVGLDGTTLIRSSTGNAWVSPTPGSRELPAGVESLRLVVEVELIEGRLKRKTRYTRTIEVTGPESYEFRPGSQGVTIHVA